MKLIDLYKEWMDTGRLPFFPGGLCHHIPEKYKNTLELFFPDDPMKNSYWGSDSTNKMDRYYSFNNFRQTIVLFICAIHNEL